jgi:hypothetical protein
MTMTVLMAALAPLAGQRPISGPGGTPGGLDFPTNQAATPQGEYDIGPDTFPIYYFLASNPGEEFPFVDSTLDNNFQQYDPVRRRDFDYAHLGNLGSAHRPLLYEPYYRRGFDVGLRQFDLYQTLPADFAFYQVERAFTKVDYFQRADQADSYFTGRFSRNFANGWNATLEYRRISQLGRRQQYPFQNTRDGALAFGLWHKSPSGRYESFITVAWNSIEQEDNGGVRVEPAGGGQFQSPNTAEVFLNGAQTRHNHRGLAFTQYFTIGPKDAPPPPPAPLPPSFPTRSPLGGRGLLDTLTVDTLPHADSLAIDTLRPPAPAPTLAQRVPRPDRRRFTLAHTAQLLNFRYKFFDRQVEPETNPFAADYYDEFLVDARGLRFFVRHHEIENTFRLRTFKPRAATRGGRSRQRDLFEAGITHRFHQLDLEAADSVINNLLLFGRLNFQPNDRLSLNTFGQFDLLDNAGDYRVYGELLLDFGRLGRFKASANNQLYAPTLMQERLYVSERLIWRTGFSKTLETNLNASLALPWLRAEAGAGYHLLNNYIYFDSLARPQQTGTPISILQFTIKKDFSLGNFHLDNLLALQTSSGDFIRLPGLFGKHSLYYNGRWFRGVMKVRLGFDLRYNNSYFAYTYHPLPGQFILQDRQKIPFYPALDGFLSMQVTRLRVFAKWEDMSGMLIDDRLFYQTAFYPHQTGSGFRLGLSWRLLD